VLWQIADCAARRNAAIHTSFSARTVVVDWFHVIEDLRVRGGLGFRAIERCTGIPASSLRIYAVDTSPPHERGETLIGLWIQVTHNDRQQLPRIAKPLSCAQASL